MLNRRRYRHAGHDIFYRVGIAWFDPETHARMQDIMLHPHDIPWNFERWRQKAENHERIWKRATRLVLRIVIDPDAFLGWCTARARQPNGDSLNGYVYQRTFGEEETGEKWRKFIADRNTQRKRKR